MHLDDRRSGLFTNLESNRHDPLFTFGCRIDVLDAWYLAHHALERVDRKACDLVRGSTLVPHEDIDHRHRDLRVLLAGCEEEANQSDEEGGAQQHWCQR